MWMMPLHLHVNQKSNYDYDDDEIIHHFCVLMPLVKSVHQKTNFHISQPKHMLWVLKRTVSMRRFF